VHRVLGHVLTANSGLARDRNLETIPQSAICKTNARTLVRKLHISNAVCGNQKSVLYGTSREATPGRFSNTDVAAVCVAGGLSLGVVPGPATMQRLKALS